MGLGLGPAVRTSKHSPKHQQEWGLISKVCDEGIGDGEHLREDRLLRVWRFEWKRPHRLLRSYIIGGVVLLE